jgi:hypothetical protein
MGKCKWGMPVLNAQRPTLNDCFSGLKAMESVGRLEERKPTGAGVETRCEYLKDRVICRVSFLNPTYDRLSF